MRARFVGLLLLGPLVAGCERDSQSLPFSPEAGEEVSRPISSEGGVVSTAAGASVEIPAGAVSGSEVVSLTPVPPPASAQRSGSPVSTAFQLEPAGTQLARAASVELRFDPAAAGADAWLASVVNLTPQGVFEHASTRVDLSTGIVESEITTFGTLAVVVPDAEAVFPVQRVSSFVAPTLSLAAAPGDGVTDSVRVSCGTPDDRCAGLVIEASANLLDRVENAAAVYPVVEGVLRIAGGSAAGEIELSTSVRAQMESGQASENVEIHALLEPTAETAVSETSGRITLTNVRQRVSGSADSGSESQQETATLEIEKSGGTGTITITRSFELRNEAGELEDAFVTVTFPVDIHQ